MQTVGDNSDYTRKVLAEVAEHRCTPEYAIIRELCALYDHFCDCIAVVEQRLYVKKRIEHYKSIINNERRIDQSIEKFCRK